MTENQNLRQALRVALDALTFDGFCPQDFAHRTLCAEAASQLRQVLALPTSDHMPDVKKMVVDHFPDATKMIETAAPVGERLTLSAEDVHAAFVKHFPKTRISQAWIGFAAEIAEAVAARAALSSGDAGWQPIETAPMDGRLGLVYRPLAANTRDEPIAIKSLIGGDRFCWPNTAPKGSAPTNPTDGACHVTHWMPLPPAPATRKDKP